MLRKYKHPPPEKDRPFANDKLQREEFGKQLLRLVASLEQPFVIALDGPWGSGKTTFAEMWMESARAAGHRCLYFNAWDHDFIEDPMIALMSQIDNDIKALGHSPQSSEAMKIWESAKTGSAALLRMLGPLAIRMATQGLLDIKGLENAIGCFDKSDGSVAELAETLTRQQLESMTLARESAANFRDRLEKLAVSLVDSEASKRPVILVIDELDRCKPTFAIALLERVKHFFAVPGFCFILAVDRSQLAHSLRVVYGAGMDTDGYLRRFLDLSVRLPELRIRAFAAHLYQHFEFHSFFGQYRDSFMDTFTRLAEGWRLSLRTMEQCFTELNVALRIVPNVWPDGRIPSTIFVMLRAARPEVFQRYWSGQAGAEDVMSTLSEPNIVSRDRETYDSLRAMLLAFSTVRDEFEAAVRTYEQAAESDPSQETRNGSERMAKHLRLLSQYRTAHFRGALAEIFDFTGRIE